MSCFFFFLFVVQITTLKYKNRLGVLRTKRIRILLTVAHKALASTSSSGVSRLVFISDGVRVGVVIRSVRFYDLVKTAF